MQLRCKRGLGRLPEDMKPFKRNTLQAMGKGVGS